MTSLLPDTLNLATLLSRRYRPEQLPDLTGKVALVTGGSAGIGYYDALALARAGAEVIITGANPEHGPKAEKEINQAAKQNGSSGSVRWYQNEMADLHEVDALAKKLARELKRLDILILNAAIAQAPYGLTADGVERHFEVNNLSHYVITLRLLPLMEKTAQQAPLASVRIVTQSSELHRATPTDIQFVSLEEVNQDRDGLILYGQTKLGLILLAKQLVARKFSSMDKPVLAMSVHPGTVDTEFQKAWTESYGNIFGKAAEKITATLGKSAPEGAEASLWAAASTDINADNWRDYQGNYYTEAYGKPEQESNQGKDLKLGDNFWNLCAKLSKKILGEDLQ
ncbi:NAD-P-binding protein [Panus rudis PR-1116 ss-1]|nr:NAD-P-binding protein [Panus rudis PR-1116 ss-1]